MSEDANNGDGTSRADYKHPFKLGWKLQLQDDGSLRSYVGVWLSSALDEHDGDYNATEPLALIDPPAAESMSAEFTHAANQAKVVSTLLPLVAEVGGDPQQFSTALWKHVERGATLDSLMALGGFGSRKGF